MSLLKNKSYAHKLDVLFFHCPVSYKVKTDHTLDHPLLGALYLAAVLEKEHYIVEVFENRDRLLTLEESVRLIGRKKPKILALSSFTSNMRGTYQLAQAVKKRFKNKIIIALGGPHISADPGIIKRYPVFDFGVTQEGEITFPKLVNKIIREGKTVKGVFKGETPLNLDLFPQPARHLVDWSRYQAFRTHNVMASRGCPFHCIFCSIPAIDRMARYRSPKLVVDEMEDIQKYVKGGWYTFLDDTLTLNRKFIIEICNEIIRRKIKINIEGHTRATLVDEFVLRKLKKAGCRELIFGVESGNEGIRNRVIRKGVRDKDIVRAINLCKKHDIKPDIYLMLGFPGETEKEMMDTVNFPLKVRPNIFGLHLTLPLPGAEIWELSIKEKIIPKNTIDQYIRGQLGEGFNDNWPIYVPKGTTLDALKDMQALSYRKYYLRPSYVIERLKKDMFSLSALKKDIQQAIGLLHLKRAQYWE